jgi:hypothetical protein
MSTSADPSVWGSFSWKFAGDALFQPEASLASCASEASARALVYADSAGGTANTGVFVWWDAAAAGAALSLGEVAAGDAYSFTLGYDYGAAFDEANSNSAHQLAECSSRGACDRASGTCTCLDGYTGQACERSACAEGGALRGAAGWGLLSTAGHAAAHTRRAAPRRAAPRRPLPAFSQPRAPPRAAATASASRRAAL